MDHCYQSLFGWLLEQGWGLRKWGEGAGCGLCLARARIGKQTDAGHWKVLQQGRAINAPFDRRRKQIEGRKRRRAGACVIRGGLILRGDWTREDDSSFEGGR